MQQLGKLEASVMDVLWRADGSLRVRDVLGELNEDRDLAYTTILTVLDNLHRKGWVAREMQGRAYCYRPMASREEVAARALRDVLDSAGDTESVLLHFAESVSEQESEILRRVLRKISRKR